MPLDERWLVPDAATLSATTQELLCNNLLRPCIGEMNGVRLRRRLPVFPDDQLPTNQRNLTDVRTRVGVLIEFELGQSIDARLQDVFGGDLRLAYVVANRFPDLEIRRLNGATGLRLEVKTLDVLAEEKAANFDTLIKDIRPGTDYVVVLLWEWGRDIDTHARYPRIRRCFVLNAFELALMRDNYWLNHPPGNVGENRQGFDIRWAVNANALGFNREEGNYGKLMRISDRESLQWLPERRTPLRTPDHYFQMCDEILDAGFDAVTGHVLDVLALDAPEIERTPTHVVDQDLVRHGFAAGAHKVEVICSRTRIPSVATLRSAASGDASTVIAMSSKFAWAVYEGGALTPVDRGRKPAQLITSLQRRMA